MRERISTTIVTGTHANGQTTRIAEWVRTSGGANVDVVVIPSEQLDADARWRSDDGSAPMSAFACACCASPGWDTRARLVRHPALRKPEMDHLIIDLRGRGDPTALLAAIATDRVLAARLAPHGVVAIVDVSNPLSIRERSAEERLQIAVSDWIATNDGDLARRAPAGFLDELSMFAPFARVLAPTESPLALPRASLDARFRPDAIAATGSISLAWAIDPAILEDRITALFERLGRQAGERLLRVRAILKIAGDEERPVLVQAARGAFFPVERLPRWPTDDRRSRLVLSVDARERSIIESAVSEMLREHRFRKAS